MKISNFTPFLVCSLVSMVSAGKMDDALQAFEHEKDFVTPAATAMGTLNNTGYISTSKVGNDLKFSFGLPIAIASVPSSDKNYTKDGKSVPTIFGGDAPTGQTSYENGSPRDYYDGSLGDYSTLGLFYLEGGVQKNFVSGKLRYLPFGVPSSLADGNSLDISIFGLGLQADINPLFSQELPVNLGVAFSYTSTSIEFGPKQYNGTLKLNGGSTYTSFIVGKSWGNAEFFADIGYETSSLEASGHLEKKPTYSPITVNPKQQFDGKNGLRAGINFAFHGPFAPVIGLATGAYNVWNLDFLHWRQ